MPLHLTPKAPEGESGLPKPDEERRPEIPPKNPKDEPEIERGGDRPKRPPPNPEEIDPRR